MSNEDLNSIINLVNKIIMACRENELDDAIEYSMNLKTLLLVKKEMFVEGESPAPQATE